MAFTRFTKNVLNVSALPDRVQNQAQTLKATFDQAGVDIKAALNALIAELEASTSADNIGADVQSVATKTVQAILTAFEEEIANRYTKTEAETLLATGTNDLVADVDVNLTTGVITIRKKDGTVETFDTAIEKVPAKFEVVENGDTYALKITNVDGTSTQADITNFMNIYTFNNSDYITFETTGTGTEKTVTANIKANSIGLDKLSLSVVSTLEGYMSSARDSANAAKTSETNARTSELNALEAKNTAINKAAEAQKSAEDAEYWAKQAESGGGGGITEIPIATADTLGGIKVGEGLEITEDGVLSALASLGGTPYLTVLWEGKNTEHPKTLTLKESIKNFDLLLIEGCCETTAVSGATNVASSMTIVNVTDMKYILQSEITGGNVVSNTYNLYTSNNSGWYRVFFGFMDETSLRVLSINKGTWTNPQLIRVTGIKCNTKVLDGTVDIDNTPTEGSENVVTSGGIKEYVDERSIKVLEASPDNVIDFNTLTETGVYLVKNSNSINALNGFPETTSYTYDVKLTVTKGVNLSTGEVAGIYQHLTYGGTKQSVGRAYNANTSAWTAWDLKISASQISQGTFADRVIANSTAVATLTNKQVRNITAQTSDLTAGTSTLATGDIVFVYE